MTEIIIALVMAIGVAQLLASIVGQIFFLTCYIPFMEWREKVRYTRNRKTIEVHFVYFSIWHPYIKATASVWAWAYVAYVIYK